MIKLENTEVVGWEHAIRGMRNPKNSWDRMDSKQCIDSCDDCDNFSVCNPNFESYFRKFWEGGSIDCDYAIGPNDHKLMMNLAKGGPVHAKYRRMIVVYVDITAPLYWWKEFDTYKVGTVANSCSTMHKIHDKEFTLDDFSCEHLIERDGDEIKGYKCCVEDGGEGYSLIFPLRFMKMMVDLLNEARQCYLDTKDKKYWWQMIQLLPSSYNQKRTIMLNYEVLVGMYRDRKNHKLDEWRVFCEWIKSLPYSELIIGEQEPEFLNKKFNIPKYEVCPECGGAGLISYEPESTKLAICHVCHGEKVVKVGE